MSRQKRDEFLDLMQLGAPPLLAIQRLGVQVEDLRATFIKWPDFARQFDDISRLVACNVEAALYKAAIGGSVSAQSTYLRLCRSRPLKPSQKTQNNYDEADSSLKKDFDRCLAPYLKQQGWKPPKT
jgi:hypothetical protein